MTPLRWSAEARIEARDATRWYSEQSPSLAERFEVAIRTTVAAILESPKRWPISRDRVHRRLVVHRFPYSLIYRILPDDQILVVAVRHHSRRPDSRFPP